MLAGGATTRRLFSRGLFSKNWAEYVRELAHAKGVEKAQAVEASKALGDLSFWVIAAVDAILNPRALKVRGKDTLIQG